MPTKRPATDEEVSLAKWRQCQWMTHNSYDDKDGDEFVAHVDAKVAEAKAEGYKNETCSCGLVYLAFHHFTRCQVDGCPFRDGNGSMLERIFDAATSQETTDADT